MSKPNMENVTNVNFNFLYMIGRIYRWRHNKYKRKPATNRWDERKLMLHMLFAVCFLQWLQEMC